MTWGTIVDSLWDHLPSIISASAILVALVTSTLTVTYRLGKFSNQIEGWQQHIDRRLDDYDVRLGKVEVKITQVDKDVALQPTKSDLQVTEARIMASVTSLLTLLGAVWAPHLPAPKIVPDL